MAHFTRREFLQTGLAAGTLAVADAAAIRLAAAAAIAKRWRWGR
jgi:hypothetical protein